MIVHLCKRMYTWSVIIHSSCIKWWSVFVSLLYKVVGGCLCVFVHCMCTLQHITLLSPVSNVSDEPGMHAYMHVCKCVFLTV